MHKVLITFLTLGLLSIQAETTMCYKENISSPALSEDTPLEGGKCLGGKSAKDMQDDGWEVNDIKITQTKTGMNFTYVFKKGGVSADDKSMSEEELIARITERMTVQRKEEAKKKKEEIRKQATARIKNIYVEKCQQCHGEKGELSAYGVARPLKDLTAEQMKNSINEYSGEYSKGKFAFVMLPYANVMSESNIEDLSYYIQSLNPKEEK